MAVAENPVQAERENHRCAVGRASHLAGLVIFRNLLAFLDIGAAALELGGLGW